MGARLQTIGKRRSVRYRTYALSLLLSSLRNFTTCDFIVLRRWAGHTDDGNTTPATRTEDPRFLQWSPIVLGALAATALSSVLLTFAVTIGLGVTSAAPTWRDASAALALLSGLYLIIQAVLSFGLGGYIAGRFRASTDTVGQEETETG